MRIDEILSQLPDAERDALLVHLRNDTPSRRISAILTANGYGVGKSSVNKWRKINS